MTVSVWSRSREFNAFSPGNKRVPRRLRNSHFNKKPGKNILWIPILIKRVPITVIPKNMYRIKCNKISNNISTLTRWQDPTIWLRNFLFRPSVRHCANRVYLFPSNISWLFIFDIVFHKKFCNEMKTFLRRVAFRSSDREVWL